MSQSNLRTVGFVLALVCLLTPTIVRAQAPANPIQTSEDPCVAILHHGIYNYIYRNATRDVTESDHTQVCSRMAHAEGASAGGSAEFEYEMAGGSGDYEQSRYSRLETAYCSLANYERGDRSHLVEAAQTLDPNAVDA